MVQIPLDLSAHCIQAEIKRLYKRQLTVCLKSSKNDSLAENKLELLRHALETGDFPTLRAEHRALAGGHNNEAFLLADDNGRLFIMLNDRTIPF